MSTPSILYRNLLAVAAEGRRRGDGTIYAWGSSATPDQANKTFDLTGITLMTDLGADADDKLNGCELIFDDGGEYLITDWVTSSKLASTFERPRAGDTGSYTIRRALYTNDFSVSNPLRYLANGRRYQKWIDKAANNTASIIGALPNLIDDGGAERNLISEYWTVETSGGTTGTVSVNSTTPILGSYDFLFDRGDRTWIRFRQPGKGDLRAGYTYGIICKNRVTTATESNLQVALVYTDQNTVYLPVTFTKINGADTIQQGSGGSPYNTWLPQITTSNAWDEIIFTVPEDVDSGDWSLRLYVDTTSEDYNVDQITIWEIGPTVSGVDQPDTFAVINHNMAGGFAASSVVEGHRAMLDLSGWGSAADSSGQYIDLGADVTVDGNSPIYETWTAKTSIFPITFIRFTAISGKTWQAGEIWLGKRWDWPKFKSGDWDPIDGEMIARVVDTEGGIEVIEDKYEKQRRTGEILRITSAEKDNWEAFERYCKLSKPFWYYHDRFTALGQSSELLFMRNASKPRLPVVNTRFNANYSFIEVL